MVKKLKIHEKLFIEPQNDFGTYHDWRFVFIIMGVN